MHIIHTPDAMTKLTRMGDVTLYEPAGDSPQAERPAKPSSEAQASLDKNRWFEKSADAGSTYRGSASSAMLQPSTTMPMQAAYQSHSLAECISHVSTPTGSKPILKTMVTTACEKNCYYCPFRAGRGKTERLTFKPDELAGAFNQLQQAGRVDGLFLSSGIIKGGVTTQDKIIDTVEIIRRKHQYRGYVHLKIMPGSEYAQIERAMDLADRLSINLEGATAERLNALAPKKDFDNELINRLVWAHEIRQRRLAEGRKTASLVTQFVVGAVGDTDLELLGTSAALYQRIGLSRVYYSPFHPISQTPFENLQPIPMLRAHRLYQASFLLRDYGWELEEFDFGSGEALDLHTDPKRAWADRHLRGAPIDVMHADRSQLMRIPGVGPRGAEAILSARRKGTLRSLADLRALGIRTPEQAAPYLLFAGKAPPQQLSLF